MKSPRRISRILAALLLLFLACGPGKVRAQSSPGAHYIVEWVYKVELGHEAEFWQSFRKYQIATLNKEKKREAF
jgi:hypothetical protein